MSGHWRRFFLQLGIAGSMLAVNAVSSDLYLVLISLSILTLPVFVWTVFVVLLWLSNQAPDIETLADAVDDMMTLGMASTVAALIAITVLLRIGHIIDFQVGSLVTVGLGFIVVAVAIPALTKLRTVRDVYLPVVLDRRRLPVKSHPEGPSAQGSEPPERI